MRGHMNDLECLHVSKNFGSLLAVDHVSLEVARGSFFSILGPSGCGKTTLMRMIAGFETPSTGDIRIKGKSVLSLAPNRRNVKMVFQHLALFPMMNVGENIAYGLRCKGVGKAEITTRVQAVLDRVGLPDAAHKEVNQLSGGQRQRIAIARCMVLEPDVLLLDEPLGALDLKLRERMKIELKLLQHQFDTTFLYITHDQSEALVMSDQVAVMNAGRFEQVGAPHELYHDPKSGFVAGFVGDSNRWPCRVLEVKGDEARVEIDGVGTMTARCDRATLASGDWAELFVRPEAISLAQGDAGDGYNRLSGIVDSLLFNGANSRILVRMSKDTRDMVEVDFPNLDSQANIRAGDEVHLSWPASRARCFALAGASA
jgi:spermidine/putrescine transport system ATP-binding protein